MSDSISRQDAIDAVCANCLRQDLEVLDGCLGEDCSIKPILESLPSADRPKGKEVARMSDLIRRQDTIDRIQGTGYAEQIKNNLLFIIWALPSADAVEVVRCKDCKHWYSDADTGMACEFTNMSQPEDGYCNWGERREP